MSTFLLTILMSLTKKCSGRIRKKYLRDLEHWRTALGLEQVSYCFGDQYRYLFIEL
jgi:hypothetical protein